MDNEAKRAFEAELAKKLALGFEAEPWPTMATLSFDEVSNWLQISGDEAGLLSTVGLLKSFDEEVELTELLRFLEAHPKWLAWRAERQVEYLRRTVENQAEWAAQQAEAG